MRNQLLPYSPSLSAKLLLLVTIICFTAVEIVDVVTADISPKQSESTAVPETRFKITSVARASNGPKIYLSDTTPLPAIYRGDPSTKAALERGHAQPLSLLSADFDADAIADLVVGYSNGEQGILGLHCGNLDAVVPQSQKSFEAVGRGDFPSPFLAKANLLNIPVHPDFVGEGTFNPNGFHDLVIAERGDSAIYLLSNDGNGEFAAPQRIDVGGPMTGLVVGQLGRPSPFSRVLLGLDLPGDASLRLYDGAPNGLDSFRSVSLTAPASNFLFDDADAGHEVFFVSEGKVNIMHSSSMKLETVPLHLDAYTIALGSFIFDRNGGKQVGVLSRDGNITIIARDQFDPRLLTEQEFSNRRKRAISASHARALRHLESSDDEWKVIETIPAVAAFDAERKPVLLRTRISDHGADDLMVLNALGGKLAILSHPDGRPGDPAFKPAVISTRPEDAFAVAALAVRVNIDGRPGVLAANAGEIGPTVMMPLPDPTFFPNRFDDPVPTSPIANACNNVSNADTSSSCSLREAVLRANATS